jgi:rhodanese-related sulfurtransferase
MTDSNANVPSDVPFEIDVQSVKGLLDSQADFLLIDCREKNEFDHCRIQGSVLIPMNETPDRVSEIELHRGKPIIVHCHHGGRSGQVVQWLRSQGFESAQNMTGGIDVWSQLIDPEVKRY